VKSAHDVAREESQKGERPIDSWVGSIYARREEAQKPEAKYEMGG